MPPSSETASSVNTKSSVKSKIVSPSALVSSVNGISGVKFRRYQGKDYNSDDPIVFRCVSLQSREDRRIKMNRLFKHLNISVDYFLAQNHPGGGMYGCFESHLNVWLDSLKLGDDQLLVIFEDDVMLNSSLTSQEFSDLLVSCRILLQRYDIVHLDRSVQKIGYPVLVQESSTFWTGESVDADLYVVSGRTIRKNIRAVMSGWGRHVDQVFRDTTQQVFIYPRIFIQRDIFDSDNSWSSSSGYDALMRSGHLIHQKILEPLQFLFQPLILTLDSLTCV